jgi:dihydropteroate synthase
MGILNVTPDSFSDGGQYAEHDRAIARGLELAAQGADIIDIGGESSRPGAGPVGLAEELRRTIPVIRELAAKTTVPISVDTTKAAVAEQALDAGAQIVNDISALRFDPAMGTVIAARRVPVVLMHMRGNPRTMQQNVRYHALMDEIRAFLQERIRAACAMGIAEDSIVIDPGIGFGKSVGQDNFTILNRLGSLRPLGRPILVGPSRKAFIGSLLGAELSDREAGTAAAVAIAVRNGAHIVRVHDVRMMSMAARVAHAISTASG